MIINFLVFCLAFLLFLFSAALFFFVKYRRRLFPKNKKEKSTLKIESEKNLRYYKKYAKALFKEMKFKTRKDENMITKTMAVFSAIIMAAALVLTGIFYPEAITLILIGGGLMFLICIFSFVLPKAIIENFQSSGEVFWKII